MEKYIFNIDLNKIRKDTKEDIDKKIEENKNENLSYSEKLLKALEEDKTTTYELSFNNNEEYRRINVKEIHEEWENEIQKKIKAINNPNLSYYQKRKIVLTELKTQTYTIKRENRKIKKIKESNVKGSGSLTSSTNSFSNEENQKKILYDDGISIKKKIFPQFDIDIGCINEEKEKIIQEKVKKINKPGLNDFEKTIEVLKDDKSSTLIINMCDKEEKKIEEKNNSEFSEEKNRKKVLKEEQTTEVNNTYNSIYNTDNMKENDKSSNILNETTNITNLGLRENDNSILDSTADKSSLNLSKTDNNISLNLTVDTTNNSLNKSDNFSIDDINQSYLNLSYCYDNNDNNDNFVDISSNSKKKDKYFNSLRTKFYLNNNLFDIILQKIPTKNIKTAEKYRINDKYYAFLYPNDLTTYYITECGFILNHKKNYSLNNDDINNNNNFITELGLYFCGKLIEYENKEHIKEVKKCCPNEFICKDCMKLNKDNYYIKGNYLINIKGRVAKINKEKYHCFGHFLVGKQIEDCINKFSCTACKMLDSISSYYM